MVFTYKSAWKIKSYYKLVAWAKHITIPSLGFLPLYTLITFFLKEVAISSLTDKASSLAYNFLLAIFPGVIFLFTLISYIPIENFQNHLMLMIASVLPKNAYSAVESTLIDIIQKQHGGLLSFGFITSLFFATNGVNNLIEVFNTSSLAVENRSLIKRRFIALLLTVFAAFALLLSVAIIIGSEYLFLCVKHNLMLHGSFLPSTIVVVRWIMMLMVYLIAVSTLYRYGPASTEKQRFFSIGACFATVVATLTTWGFAFYINHFGTYNKIYGSIGTLIVVMTWLYLNSLIILIGFEVNASLNVLKRYTKYEGQLSLAQANKLNQQTPLID